MPGFDKKIFNAEAFGRYVDTIPRVKQNQFLKAGILNTRNDLKTMLSEQTGGNYVTVPMFGRIGGEALNYDGATRTLTVSYTQASGKTLTWTTTVASSYQVMAMIVSASTGAYKDLQQFKPII